MADEIKGIQQKITVTTDTSGIQQGATAIDQANENARQLAESLSQVEKAFTGMKAGTQSASKAVTSMVKVYDELNKELQLAKQSGNTELASSIEKSMAKVKTTIERTQSEINKIRKAGLSEQQAIGTQSLNATIRANNAEIKAEKEASKQLQQVWRDELKQYQNIQAQKSATSSLKDFNTGNSGLKINESLFNTAIAVTGINNLTGAFQNLGREVIDIQYNLVNTQRIMDDFSKENRDRLLENAAETARLTNIQITDAQEIQSAWVRINDQYAENADLLAGITTLTSKFMNVGEIEDAEQAVNLLNASLLQFGHTGEEALKYAEEFANKWAYMADITAMGTADEYGEAISKYGAVVKQLNGDMDESIALASIMADRLAKNGAEAGTSLKTFTTYMNRAKTIDLFNQIAADLGDTSYQLADANGGLKDFDENLRLIAKAYKEYRDMGNDVMANKVLEAVGATRQRDSAMAVINAVNEGDYDKYMQELQSDAVDNYLNEQNAALMETLSASINSLVVSFQELGMALGNAGIIQGVTLIVDGLSGLLNIVSQIPEPIMGVVNAMVGLKIAQSAASYIGNLTGITQQYQSLLKQGTQAEIDNANTISASANAYMKRMEFMGQAQQLSKEEIQILFNQKDVLDDLTAAYNNGEITANQYSEAVTNLIGKEELDANAKRESAASEKLSTTAIKQSVAERVKSTYAIQKENAAKVLSVAQNKIYNSSLWQMITNTRLGAVANNLLSTSFSGLSAIAGIAGTAIKGFVAALNPIMAVVSIGSMIGSLFGLFNDAGNAAEDSANKVSELESELEDVNKKIKELQQLSSSGLGSEDLYENELNYWRQRKQEILDNIEAEKQLQAKEKAFGGEKTGLFGLWGKEDNVVNNASDNIKKLQDAVAGYAAVSKEAAEGGIFDEETMASARAEIKATIQELQDQRSELQTIYDTLKDTDIVTPAQLSQIEQLQKNIDNTLGAIKSADSLNIDLGSTFDLEEFISGLEQSQEEITALDDDISKLADGTATAADLQRMTKEYEGFYEYVGKGAKEQIAYLNSLKNESENLVYSEITSQMESLQQEREKLQQQLEEHESGKITLDDESLEETKNRITEIGTELDNLEALRTINIDIKMPSDEISDQLDLVGNEVSTLTDLFDEYNEEGYLANETVREMLKTHPDYVKYLVKEGDQYKLNEVALADLERMKKQETETTDDLVNALKNESEGIGLVTDECKEALTASNEFIDNIQNTFGNIKGVDEFANDLRTINNDFLNGQTTLDQYSNSMEGLISKMDFSKVNDDLSQMDEKTQQVAYSQQAMLTSLTSNVASFLQSSTTAFANGEMSVQQYTAALSSSNQQLLEMYTKANDLTFSNGQWVNAAGEVDTYAMSLYNATNALDSMSQATQFLTDNYTVLSEISAAVAQGQVDDAWWTQMQSSAAYQAMANDFSSAMSYLYENNRSAWSAIATDVANANGMTVTDTFNANGSISEGVQLSAAAVDAGVNAMINQLGASVSVAAQAGGNVISSFGKMIANFDYDIKAKPYITGSFGLKTDKNGIPTGINLPTFGFKITGTGGKSVQNFASALGDFGNSIKGIDFGSLISLGSFAPSSSYKPVGSSGLGGSGYKPSSYNRPAVQRPSSSGSKKGSGSKGSGSKGSGGKSAAEKAAEAAEKAAEEAAKAAQEAAEAIERLTEQYIQNVEDLQSRIANALKKKYQEQYDERKKLLEKEHNDRVEQIQAEIDAINGDRPEDKQSELNRLQKKLEQWKNDDSTLGKQKQKEYLDQIAELEKEIKLDELNDKMDEENENYENSINSDSEFYDAILKQLDKQMTDEMLYREANDLIRNEKTQQIIDLLTKYDAQWDGWATLMGKTAGEIIAEEVKLAIANYKDVKEGTITPDGGKYTNGITGGSTNKPSSGGSSGSSSSSGTIAKGKKAKITNTSAGMYVSYDSKRAVDNWKGWTGTYYIVNMKGSRVALGKKNSISSAIGWIDKKYVKAFDTGGYTANSEGFAMLHKKERVLNPVQTAAFENLVYDFLPKIDDLLLRVNGESVTNDNSVTFQKELVSVKVDKVINNTPYDVQNQNDNLDRMLRQSLRKAGINLKR